MIDYNTRICVYFYSIAPVLSKAWLLFMIKKQEKRIRYI